MRVVLDPDGRAVVDYRGKLPGRGAWVHPARACLEVVDRGPAALSRAFKRPVPAPDIGAQVRAAVDAALLDGLSMAAAAGALVGGNDQLTAAIAEGRILEIVVASDAAVRTVEGLVQAAGPTVPFTTVPLDRVSLGKRVGRGPRAALGVTSSRAATHLRRQLRRLRALG